MALDEKMFFEEVEFLAQEVAYDSNFINTETYSAKEQHILDNYYNGFDPQEERKELFMMIVEKAQHYCEKPHLMPFRGLQ